MDYTLDGDLKTADGIANEAAIKTEKLVASLSCKIEEKNMHLQALECEYQERTVSLKRTMEQREQLLQSYNQEIQKMQQLSVERTKEIVDENKKLRLDLQCMTRELDAKSKQLDELAAQTDSDGRNLKLEKQRNAMKCNHLMLAEAEQEQQKVDEDIGKLIEQHKSEKETYLDTIKLNDHVKHKLELEIKHLTQQLELIKHTLGSENSESGKIIAELSEEIDYTESYNQGLIVQGKKTAVEIQEAQKLVIDATQGSPGQTSGRAHIGIRMIGELDWKAFSNVCRQKFPKDDAEVESIKLCSNCPACYPAVQGEQVTALSRSVLWLLYR